MQSSQTGRTGIRTRLRWAIFPGMNLHARLRYRLLPDMFGACPAGSRRLILDAGCGNGMLSYAAYRKGNRVVGVSIKPEEVRKCSELFNGYLGIPEDRLAFREQDLHALGAMSVDGTKAEFDEIICSEVLEHIEDDRGVLRAFRDALKPGGVLHLCCPNAAHPDNQTKELDEHEHGGHVRPGYTYAAYEDLLSPLGFRIEARMGLGGAVRQFFNRRTIRTQLRFGAWAGILWVLPGWLLIWADPSNPKTPYSVYVRAVKREGA